MQLTRHTDYGLRILIYLAMLPEGRMANIDEVSEHYQVSRNNVNKLVHQLGKAGVIATRRGKGGGFYLNREPAELKLGELILLMENTMQLVDCGSPPCKIVAACKLKGLLAKATQAFVDTLNQYTLADVLTGKRKELAEIFVLELS